MEKLVVIDGNSLANRAFYAIPMLSNSKGVITNAVYGFINMMNRLLDQEKPDYFAVAFDVSRKVFRHEVYADYKAQRKGMPDELRGQMDLIKDVLRAMNIPILEMAGFEGDDVIGTLSHWCEEENIQCIIVTGDKDSLQLVSDSTTVYLTRKGISEIEAYTPAYLKEQMNLMPDQIRDLKGLMGDSSDNIPGVPGVGEKTALKLLQDYGTVEELYNHLDDFGTKKLGEKLRDNRDMAFLSKELATIYRTVDMAFDKANLALKHPDVTNLYNLYKDLELNGLLKEFESRYASAPSEEVKQDEDMENDYINNHSDGKLISQLAELEALVNTNLPTHLFMIVDTDDAPLFDRQVQRLGFIVDAEPYFLSTEDIDFPDIAMALKPWLENVDVMILTDDAKKLYSVFYPYSVIVTSLIWDYALNAYLLRPEAKERSYVADMAESYHLGQFKLPENPMENMFTRLKALYLICDELAGLLNETDMTELYAKLELPLSGVLVDMEYTGIRVDIDYLKKMGAELTKRIEELAQKLYKAAGQEFNLNSTKQLGSILFETMQLPVIKKTKTGYSTDAEVLETLAEDYEFVRDILEYRQLSKLNSTYIEGFLKLMKESDPIIHTTFQQTVTATGRLSSTEPNLQNIPVKTEEGKRIRKAFLPQIQGNVLVAADYSQIELRVLAHMSQDSVLMESFRNNEDIHKRTASEVFHVPMEEVTKEMRRNAKAVNFGIVYGQTDFGLSKELGISRKEAKAYIDGYFDRYTGVRDWIGETIGKTRDLGYTTTLMGRRRPIKDINSKNFNLRSFAERTAVNSPIQGTAADIIKVAMLEVQERLIEKQFKARMLLQVHDELIFEVPPQEIAALISLLRDCMENAVQLDVPLKVDVSVGFNWYDMERV